MSDLLLAIIAFSVAIMAAIQVTAVVFAVRAARRLDTIAGRLEKELHPVLANLQAVSADAARATSLAAAQVERVDRIVTEMTARLEDTRAAFQSAVSGTGGEGSAWVAGLKAVLAAIRELRRSEPRSNVEGDDALFI